MAERILDVTKLNCVVKKSQFCFSMVKMREYYDSFCALGNGLPDKIIMTGSQLEFYKRYLKEFSEEIGFTYTGPSIHRYNGAVIESKGIPIKIKLD